MPKFSSWVSYLRSSVSFFFSVSFICLRLCWVLVPLFPSLRLSNIKNYYQFEYTSKKSWNCICSFPAAAPPFTSSGPVRPLFVRFLEKLAFRRRVNNFLTNTHTTRIQWRKRLKFPTIQHVDFKVKINTIYLLEPYIKLMSMSCNAKLSTTN